MALPGAPRVQWGTPRAAVLLALATWVPLVVASAVEGLARGWIGSFASDVGVHARLLLAMPLAVFAEKPIARRFERALRYLVDARLIDDENRSRCVAAVRRAERLRDSIAVDPLLAIGALALSAVDLHVRAHGARTWIFPDSEAISTGGWIHLVWSAPVARFVLLRWAWRFVVWTFLLVQLARSPLHVNPAHPDGEGGLLVVMDAHTSFGWLALASGIALAGNLWSERVRSAGTVLDHRVEMLVFSLGVPLLLLVPLFAFAWPIERARRRYRAQYGAAAADFVARYARLWIDPKTRTALPLGTGETSAHTDLVTSFARVESTRGLPFTKSQYLTLLAAAALPMLLLTLQDIPLLELLRRIKGVIG